MSCLYCKSYDEVADYRLFEHGVREYQIRNRHTECSWCLDGYIRTPGVSVWDRATGYWTLRAYFRDEEDAQSFCRGRWKSIKHRPHDTRMPGDIGPAQIEPDGHGRPALRSEWR